MSLWQRGTNMTYEPDYKPASYADAIAGYHTPGRASGGVRFADYIMDRRLRITDPWEIGSYTQELLHDLGYPFSLPGIKGATVENEQETTFFEEVYEANSKHTVVGEEVPLPDTPMAHHIAEFDSHVCSLLMDDPHVMAPPEPTLTVPTGQSYTVSFSIADMDEKVRDLFLGKEQPMPVPEVEEPEFNEDLLSVLWAHALGTEYLDENVVDLMIEAYNFVSNLKDMECERLYDK